MDGKQVSNTQNQTENQTKKSSTSAEPSAQQVLQQLHSLQKQYFKDQLLGEHAHTLQQQRIRYFFQTCETIQLKQVIDVQQLIGVVHSQVYKINLKPALLSVIGEIAQNIHRQLSQSNAPLSDFISDQQVEHWLRKILELDDIFDYLKIKIAQTPQIRSLCAYWINQNIAHFRPKHLDQVSEKTFDRLPTSVQRFVYKQAQKLEEHVEIKTAQLFQQQLLFLLNLEKAEYLSLGMSLWHSLKHSTVAEFSQMSTPLDTEEVFILSYEFWKDFRHNQTFQHIIEQGIRDFYATFADENIYTLFLATGLNIEDIQLEAERFAPSILKRLDELGLLDTIIDHMIQPFFQSEHTIDQLNQVLKQRF
ncbi:hypothetical protein SAMN05421749_101504 [Acinetobacter marinus]|uniref:Uncharacterized protein n=1 Tax=Acinetobacter marinus TaxID=281375 RepID=A0A1G6GWM8_9GAMM|nr:hypothetical protein SAMN05421749_101504 [Acinetobacter marinus]